MKIKNTDWDRVWRKEGFDSSKITASFDTYTENIIKKEIIEYFGSFEGLKIVGLGAGRGIYLLKMNCAGAKTTLVDYSDMSCKFSKNLFKHHKRQAEIIKADIFSLPDDMHDKFDVSISLGLAEHFYGEDRQKVFDIHYNVIRNGGLSIMAVPNLFSPSYQIWQKCSRFLDKFDALARKFGTNQIKEKLFSRKELIMRGEKSHFCDITIKGNSFIDDTENLILGNIIRFFTILLFNKDKRIRWPAKKTFLDNYLGAYLYLIGHKK